jgi:hypothetical protein
VAAIESNFLTAMLILQTAVDYTDMVTLLLKRRCMSKKIDPVSRKEEMDENRK